MPKAMISPSRHTCQDRRCTPAVNVPSDNKVKIASPVAFGAEIPLHGRQQQHVYDNDECEPV